LLGPNYIAGLSADGSTLKSMFTMPAGVAGQSVVSAGGSVAALGSSGTVLISSGAAAPSLLGIAAAPAFSATSAVTAREVIALYGLNIGPAQPQTAAPVNGVLPRTLGGVQVSFDGHPAALLYAGPSQINAIVPATVAGRAATALSILTPAGLLTGPTLAVRDTAPVIYTDAGGSVAALNEDGTLNSFSNPAPHGSILAFWFTGGGAAFDTPDDRINSALRGNPLPVSVLVPDQSGGGNVSAEVLYAGDAPTQPSGVIQVNFRSPAWLPSALNFQLQVGSVVVPLPVWVR
jgi:uncharacterized protein (TIGR03437 family)